MGEPHVINSHEEDDSRGVLHEQSKSALDNSGNKQELSIKRGNPSSGYPAAQTTAEIIRHGYDESTKDEPSGTSSPSFMKEHLQRVPIDDATATHTLCSTRQTSSWHLSNQLPVQPSATSPDLPSLPYTIRDHKLSVVIIWTLLAFDSAIIPLVLFFGLWFGSTLDPSYICVATTSVFGVVSGLEWFFRSYKLMTCAEVRPLGVVKTKFEVAELSIRQSKSTPSAPLRSYWHSSLLIRKLFLAPLCWCRSLYWGFDAFHWSYTLGYGVALIELIVGSSFDEPYIRLCAAPSATFVVISAIIVLLPSMFNTIPQRHRPRIPIRISSQSASLRKTAAQVSSSSDGVSPQRGEDTGQPTDSPESSLISAPTLKPAIYTIVEDVIAVDTGKGREWRQAVLNRYNASWRFRKLLHDLDLFWGLSGLVVGGVTLVIIAVPMVDELIAYGIGWGLPPAWALLCAFTTWLWVRRVLAVEEEEWSRMQSEKSNMA